MTNNNNGTIIYERSKILCEFAHACGVEHLLRIKHAGARRSLILQVVRRKYLMWLDDKFENLPRIQFRQIPIKSGGNVIGYLD